MKLFDCWLPIPPSINATFGGGSGQRRFKSKKYKEWEKQAYAVSRNFEADTISEPVRVSYRFFFGDKRTRDIENYCKVISDFLVNQRIIEDDGHHIIPAMDLRFGGIDKSNPRVEIEIYQI